jgi:hypothetical protein
MIALGFGPLGPLRRVCQAALTSGRVACPAAVRAAMVDEPRRRADPARRPGRSGAPFSITTSGYDGLGRPEVSPQRRQNPGNAPLYAYGLGFANGLLTRAAGPGS